MQQADRLGYVAGLCVAGAIIIAGLLKWSLAGYILIGTGCLALACLAVGIAIEVLRDTLAALIKPATLAKVQDVGRFVAEAGGGCCMMFIAFGTMHWQIWIGGGLMIGNIATGLWFIALLFRAQSRAQTDGEETVVR